MKNKYLFQFFFFLFFCSSVFAQTPDSYVVNSSGGYFSNANTKLDFSLGEPVINDFTNSSAALTLGFLQPLKKTAGFAVNLLNLNAFYSNKTVLLTWQTVQEISNDYFDIEHSSDGNLFTKFATVKVTGETGLHYSYNFIDANPFPNKNYYRLKQFDNNGQYILSGIVALTTPAFPFTITVSPNPFASNIYIHSSLQSAIIVKVFDLNGKPVFEKNISGNGLSIDLSVLADGMYFLKTFTSDGKFIQSDKITKQ